MPPLYERHSPSKLNLWCAQPAMFVLEYLLGVRQPVGVPAHRGVAVEDGVTHGLVHMDVPLKDCTRVAQNKYDMLTALSGDPRRAKYRQNIDVMVETALDELRPYGMPTATQELIEWKPDGLKLPIVGYLDFRWDQHGIVADLKTTERIPSQIKIPHARQIAHYMSSDNMKGHIIYCSPKKVEPYLLENVREHRQALVNIAKRVETWLSLSNDPEFFVSITAPDLESFYWLNPDARALAFKYWCI